MSIISSDSELVNETLESLNTTLRGDINKSKKTVDKTNRGDDLLQFFRGLPLLAHTLAIRGNCKEAILDKPIEPEDWWFENWAVNIALCYGHLHLIPDILTLYRQHSAQTAGAPSRRGGESRVLIQSVSILQDSYARLIKQLNYTRRLMARDGIERLFDEKERKRRECMFSSYIDFLTKRLFLRSVSKWYRWIFCLNLLWFGKYHQFSRGWLSFAKDALI